MISLYLGNTVARAKVIMKKKSPQKLDTPMISLDIYYALLVLYVKMKCIPCWRNVVKKIMITFARATVLPRYSEIIFIFFCIGSTPNRKVRKS